MKIALVGNQNSGKTTLFNCLTGSNQKVGNWPGVTIEKKVGKIKGGNHEIIDLPGIYSFSPYTSEEEVSRKFVVEEKPDLVINIIDATSIERSLYLTTQLMELDSEIIIALNMTDILEKKGITIDVDKLSQLLGVRIMKISAKKKTGIQELINAVNNFSDKRAISKIYPIDIEAAIATMSAKCEGGNKRFIAVKALEGIAMDGVEGGESVDVLRKELEINHSMDIEQLFAHYRYNYICEVKSLAVTVKLVVTMTEKLDKVFLNKWAALPIFAIIMVGIYYLSVGVIGGYTVELVDGLVGKFADWFAGVLGGWGASAWSVSLVCDGVIAGTGAILNFLPQLAILFLCISLLETTGYMSRIAFVLDRLFKRFGLSGKSLIPFIVGSGCSVPGIMTARTVEDESERKMTIMLTPFVPCSAKLPIIALFGGYFFGDWSGLVTASLYLFAIVVILLLALVMKKFFFKGETSNFMSELPDYKLPSPMYVLRDVWEKTWAFVKRAGTVIFVASIVVWFLLSFSWKFEYGVAIDNSILAGIGNALAWLFYPMLGEWSWGAAVSAIQGLVAKEQVITSMTIIGGFAEGATGAMIFGAGGVFGFFNGASAYAFIVFNLFSAPCFGAISAMKKELGSVKKMLVAVGMQTVIAFVLSYLVFGIGSLILMI